MNIRYETVVNAAGLGSDAIASMAGIDIDAAGYRMHPCKREYFAVSDRHRGKLSYLELVPWDRFFRRAPHPNPMGTPVTIRWIQFYA